MQTEFRYSLGSQRLLFLIMTQRVKGYVERDISPSATLEGKHKLDQERPSFSYNLFAVFLD